jgi:hypothetical protein
MNLQKTINTLSFSLFCLVSATNYSFAETQKTSSLTDISPNHWAFDSIQKLIEKYGLKLGYPDNTFRGNKNLTRYEMAALIVQVLEKIN